MNDFLGCHKLELDTPALLLDLGAFERNLKKMQGFVDAHGVRLRPHFKAHRTPEIVRWQHQLGARGVTCAKLAEAEHLASLGFDDFLVANQVAGEIKLRRLAALSAASEVTVAADSEAGVRAMDQAARSAGVAFNVVIEVDLGMNRSGVAAGESTLALARTITGLPGLRFRGLMAYEGHLVDLALSEEKNARIRATIERLIETRRLLERSGIPVEIVSCGGTGSYHVTATCPGVTEIQAGTYGVGDTLFARAGSDFECAATVLATVTSRPTPDRAITDCGLKAIHPIVGLALARSHPNWKLQPLSAEHGRLVREGQGPDLRVGEKVEFEVFYADGTINLHERWFCLRDGRVEDIWEISGRGKSQ
ncbi:MAG: DSD1 family PLP-dependent enzyme [Planctomycetes bacterium]|nr:DSD1 family PLP-dependent enzyme [Planctomycetota bacterium]